LSKLTPAKLADLAVALASHGAPYIKLRPYQLQWLAQGLAQRKDVVACVARQTGKTFWLATHAVAQCNLNPGFRYKWAAPTQKAVFAILEPTLKLVCAELSERHKPSFDRQQSVWTFPNGSTITAAGCDNGQYDRLRGQTADEYAIDEAGFVDDLELVEGVLSPQRSTTGGIGILTSTPAVSLAHPFRDRFLAAKSINRAIHATMYANTAMSEQQRDDHLSREADARGMSLEQFKASTLFRREYLAEFVGEETRRVTPAWTEEITERCVLDVARPEFFDAYQALDIGYVDGNCVLFGWWDYVNQRLVIEDELHQRQKLIKDLAVEWKKKDAALYGVGSWNGMLRASKHWIDPPEYLKEQIDGMLPTQPYLRVGDNDHQKLGDLTLNYGIGIYPTEKTNKHAAIDDLNVAIRQGQILVAPRCEQLRFQLDSLTWNKQRSEFERTKYGHGEAIDALVYMWRNINKDLDPRPKRRDALLRTEDREDFGYVPYAKKLQ